MKRKNKKEATAIWLGSGESVPKVLGALPEKKTMKTKEKECHGVGDKRGGDFFSNLRRVGGAGAKFFSNKDVRKEAEVLL